MTYTQTRIIATRNLIIQLLGRPLDQNEHLGITSDLKQLAKAAVSDFCKATITSSDVIEQQIDEIK